MCEAKLCLDLAPLLAFCRADPLQQWPLLLPVTVAPVQVQYPAQGYATFMLGSRIPHRVTPVEINPSGERMTLIQSLSSLAADAPDATIPTSFRVQDPRQINDSETARHYAWRAQAKLERIVKTGMALE